MNTPFEVAHGGGIFRSVTVEHGSEDDAALKKMNEDVMRAFRHEIECIAYRNDKMPRRW